MSTKVVHNIVVHKSCSQKYSTIVVQKLFDKSHQQKSLTKIVDKIC